MPFIGRIFILISWASAVFIFIATPMPEYTGDKITYYDKVVHVILFGVFAFLIIYVLRAKKISLFLVLLISFVAGIVYSACGEYIQGFIPGRTVSIYDFYAGVIGVISAQICGYGKYFKRKT